LGEWIIHLVVHARLIVARQAPVAHMTNHTYDLDGRGSHPGKPDVLANNIPAAESVPGEIFVNNHYRLAAPAVMFIEEATPK
jgi:hypothetical protein